MQSGSTSSVWTDVNGWRMHARYVEPAEHAERPAIVLVHGLGVSSRYMMPTAMWLGREYDVLAPDLPGFGRSAKPRHVLRFDELADALAGWMDGCGLLDAVLVGNSVGCQTLVEFALRHPSKVRRLVLVGPTVDPEFRSPGAQVPRWLVNSTREPASLGLVLARDYADCGPSRVLQTFRYALNDYIEGKLPQVLAPTLVVRGQRDAVTSQRWVEEVTRLLPRARLAVVPGAAHTVNYSAPLELARVTRAFLEEAWT